MTTERLASIKDYVQLAREIWDTFGLATILVGVGVATWFGWISSPFSEARDLMQQHLGRTEIHISHDTELLFYMKTICQTNAELAKQSTAQCNWDPRQP